MTGDPLWSVLIPTLASRHDQLLRLLGVLLPQAEAHGGVEVVALHNNGEWPLGEIRQALLTGARGKYVSFVDDDDLVEPDYVELVTGAMVGDPDFVAFGVALYVDGTLHPYPTVTGLQYGGWYDSGAVMYRDITHVNPVRTSLAVQADFRKPHDGWEDRGYVWAVRPLLRTQAEIPRQLYHYYSCPSNSVQGTLPAHTYADRPVVASPAFRWHPWSTGLGHRDGRAQREEPGRRYPVRDGEPRRGHRQQPDRSRDDRGDDQDPADQRSVHAGSLPLTAPVSLLNSRQTGGNRPRPGSQPARRPTWKILRSEHRQASYPLE